MADLDEVRAFRAVVVAGSVKAAAEALAMPRSTLRRRLAALEQRVGVSLLWTDAAGVHPTPAGRVLMREGEAIIDAYQTLIERARAAD
ncbi:MAG: hypothetical protein Tsb0020_49910 [Haliangiales bacterium]